MSLSDTGEITPANKRRGSDHPLSELGAPYRFKKGQSGNPNGRPRKIEKATDTAVDALQSAIERAASLVDNEDPRIALAAAQLIIDRAMGKPKQTVETKDATDVRELDERELLAIARQQRSSEGDDTQAESPRKSH